MDKISITIVAYHNYADIIGAVRTIEEYTDKRIKKHIYIVDNGAEDCEDTVEFVRYINSFADTEYIDTERNLGFGQGHNYVIDMLDSEYHAIVNPDIVLKEDSFSRIIAFMQSDNTIGMCVPKIVDQNGEMQFACRKNPTIFDMFIRMFCKDLFLERCRKHTLQDQDYTKSFLVPFAQGSFLVIKTELFKALKGFDDKFFMYMEDADLCRRVNQVAKLMYCPDTEVIHKWEKGSHKNKKLFVMHLKSMRYYFNKWGWKLF